MGPSCQHETTQARFVKSLRRPASGPRRRLRQRRSGQMQTRRRPMQRKSNPQWTHRLRACPSRGPSPCLLPPTRATHWRRMLGLSVWSARWLRPEAPAPLPAMRATTPWRRLELGGVPLPPLVLGLTLRPWQAPSREPAMHRQRHLLRRPTPAVRAQSLAQGRPRPVRPLLPLMPLRRLILTSLATHRRPL